MLNSARLGQYVLVMNRAGLQRARHDWPKLPHYRPSEIKLLRAVQDEPRALQAAALVKQVFADVGAVVVKPDPSWVLVDARRFLENRGSKLREEAA